MTKKACVLIYSAYRTTSKGQCKAPKQGVLRDIYSRLFASCHATKHEGYITVEASCLTEAIVRRLQKDQFLLITDSGAQPPMLHIVWDDVMATGLMRRPGADEIEGMTSKVDDRTDMPLFRQPNAVELLGES